MDSHVTLRFGLFFVVMPSLLASFIHPPTISTDIEHEWRVTVLGQDGLVQSRSVQICARDVIPPMFD